VRFEFPSEEMVEMVSIVPVCRSARANVVFKILYWKFLDEGEYGLLSEGLFRQIWCRKERTLRISPRILRTFVMEKAGSTPRNGHSYGSTLL
jgi:hypothetical protein